MAKPFDITKPITLENDAALALLVLTRFQTGEGPFTVGDAKRVAEVIDLLVAAATAPKREPSAVQLMEKLVAWAGSNAGGAYEHPNLAHFLARLREAQFWLNAHG